MRTLPAGSQGPWLPIDRAWHDRSGGEEAFFVFEIDQLEYRFNQVPVRAYRLSHEVLLKRLMALIGGQDVNFLESLVIGKFNMIWEAER
jgi:hypothetical protein